ncbi:hypothetical protein GCM10025776_20780 [Corallincola platygyrae]
MYQNWGLLMQLVTLSDSSGQIALDAQGFYINPLRLQAFKNGRFVTRGASTSIEHRQVDQH